MRAVYHSHRRMIPVGLVPQSASFYRALPGRRPPAANNASRIESSITVLSYAVNVIIAAEAAAVATAAPIRRSYDNYATSQFCCGES